MTDSKLHKAGEGNIRVLLIDDQRIVAAAFENMISCVDDMQYAYCADPAQALNQAETFRPTVILQDLVMPGTNGLILLNQFKSNAVLQAVPVIVLSTKEDPKIKSEAFALGAADYLVKFPDSIELLARIRAHSRSFLAQQQRDEAYQRLSELQYELQQKNIELERLSCSDGLTGILNRRSFDSHIRKEWLRAVREKKDLGLLLIDIDHFKAYNDNYGHQGGDECLRQVADALKVALKRPSDIVARYGGEEFAVVLPDTNKDGATIIAEALRSGVESLAIAHLYSSTVNYVTVSLGVTSIIPGQEDSLEQFIRIADQALYSAKAAGRNRYVFKENQ